MTEPPETPKPSRARHAHKKSNADPEGGPPSHAWRAIVFGAVAAGESVLLAFITLYQPFSIWAVLLLSASVILFVIIILNKMTEAKWFMQAAAWALVGVLAISGVAIKVTQTRPQSTAQSVPCPASLPKASATAATSTSSASGASVSPQLIFDSLPDWKAEGKVVPVTLIGRIPGGTYLWIFVYHAGLYYAQGVPVSDGPNLWQLTAVNLGGSKGDLGSWFTIYAVQANLQANKLIQNEYDNTHDRNYGLAVIPGGSGAKKIAYIYACRSH